MAYDEEVDHPYTALFDHELDSPEERAEREAAFARGRAAGDGIPRTADGMKWDWECPELDDDAQAALEEYIERLIKEQSE